MAGVIQIIIALVVGYGCWKVVPVLWRYYTFCRLIRPFKCKRKRHWFWGHLKTMNFAESMVARVAALMEITSNKMLVEWISIIPNLQAIHPDTAAIVLKSTEPKPTGIGSTYSLFTPFLGENSLVVSNGSKWERNRKLLTAAFHFDVLRAYVNVYNDAADILLDKFAKTMLESPASVDIMNYLNLATLDIILRCSLSCDENIQESKKHPYTEAVHEIGRLTMERISKPWYFLSWTLFKTSAIGREYMKHVHYVHRFADEIIAKRRKTIRDEPSILQHKKRLDFLDIIMTAKDETGSGLTDKEIRDEVNTFMFGGHDTTKATMTWAIYNLGKYPEEQEILYQEVCDVTGDQKNIEWEDLGKLPRMSMFLKETLRMYPPAGSTTRYLTKPLEVEGVTIPAGNSVDVSIVAIHYRPDVFPDPTEFRPERFLPENTEKRHPFAFIPFSAGQRNCIGKNFAMNEMKVLLGRTLKRFKVVLDEDHEVIPTPMMILQSRDGIKVRFEERR